MFSNIFQLVTFVTLIQLAFAMDTFDQDDFSLDSSTPLEADSSSPLTESTASRQSTWSPLPIRNPPPSNVNAPKATQPSLHSTWTPSSTDALSTNVKSVTPVVTSYTSSNEPYIVKPNGTSISYQTNTTSVPSSAEASADDTIQFCTPISVERDATYCISGTVCSGDGDVPAGISCPQAGTAAVGDCIVGLRSYNPSSQRCFAPVSATCSKLSSTGVWGCVWP